MDDAPFPANWTPAGGIAHVFTHFELRLKIYTANGVHKQTNSDGWWVKVEKLADEALPTVMKKAIAAAIPDAFAKTRKVE